MPNIDASESLFLLVFNSSHHKETYCDFARTALFHVACRVCVLPLTGQYLSSIPEAAQEYHRQNEGNGIIHGP